MGEFLVFSSWGSKKMCRMLAWDQGAGKWWGKKPDPGSLMSSPMLFPVCWIATISPASSQCFLQYSKHYFNTNRGEMVQTVSSQLNPNHHSWCWSSPGFQYFPFPETNVTSAASRPPLQGFFPWVFLSVRWNDCRSWREAQQVRPILSTWVWIFSTHLQPRCGCMCLQPYHWRLETGRFQGISGQLI